MLFKQLASFKNTKFLTDVFTPLGSDPDTSPKPSIGFLLAHPDDESMFFVPTLKVLTNFMKQEDSPDVPINLLYLSNGNAEGKGVVREAELSQLCSENGYSCTVLDDPNLQDGNEMWVPQHALEHVKKFVTDNNVKVLFTFDDLGVSGHPNHLSTHLVAKLVSSEMEELKVYYLESLKLFPKYLAFFALPVVVFKRHSFVSFSPLKVLFDMLIHRSQLRAHVPLWSFLSSYAYLNTFTTNPSQ